jgi:hypothetical protein
MDINESKLAQLLARWLSRAIEVVASDPELRSGAIHAAEFLVSALKSASDAVPVDTSTKSSINTDPSNERIESASPFSPASAEPLPPLTLGQSRSSETKGLIELPAPHLPAEIDLSVIEQRCALKAEACRWAERRRRLLDANEDYRNEIQPVDADLIARAKQLENCYLWMSGPNAPNPSSLAAYDLTASCFDAVVDVVKLLRKLSTGSGFSAEFEQALDMAAEVQSALRVAVERLDASNDRDQLDLFNWLKQTATKNHIFIERYMRHDSRAEPEGLPDLSERIESLDARLQDQEKRSAQRKKLLGKIRHKAGLILKSEGDATEHWPLLAKSVDEYVATGVPPSNVELRDALIPTIEQLPDDLDLSSSPRFLEVLREIDHYLSREPAIVPSHDAVLSDHVNELRELVRGSTIVMIGGHRRQMAAQAIEKALQLKELVWVDSAEHQSIDRFEAPIARPDVTVVVLAIRWSSHSFGEIKHFCDQYQKLLVRLPGGYSPNQLANQILDQCGDRLRQAKPAA